MYSSLLTRCVCVCVYKTLSLYLLCVCVFISPKKKKSYKHIGHSSTRTFGDTILVSPNALIELCPIYLITEANINSTTTIHHFRV